MADENNLTWCLSDLDLLERAGLAALYMALEAATALAVDLSPLTWRKEDLKPDSVTVHCCGSEKSGFMRLMEWAWQVCEGVLYLPAVHDARDAAMIQNRVATHNGIMHTFLQHPNAQPKLARVSRVIELGEQQTVAISFAPPAAHVNDAERGFIPNTKRLYQKKIETDRLRPHEDLIRLFDRYGRLNRKEVSLSSWAFPGIGGRYGEERKGKAWRGPSKLALLLMLAPTVCFYLRLPKSEVRIKSKKVMIDNWVAVIPDVRQLKDFADIRPRLAVSADGADAASLGDAGMHFLSRYITDQPRRRLHADCRVVAMGKVSYYPNQSVRKAVLDVSAGERAVKRYRILLRELRNAYVPWNPGWAPETPDNGVNHSINRHLEPTVRPKAAGRILVPAARGRIADNIVQRRDWYTEIGLPSDWDHARLEKTRKRNKEFNDRDGRNRPTSHETILFVSLRRQRSQMMNLISEDEMWTDLRDREFVEAFWDTLSRCYYLEKKAAEYRGGTRSVHDRINDFNAKLHRELLQSSTHSLLRKTLAEFFALPATLPRSDSLRDNVAVVWRIIDTDWRKGRDLAMLALMTYTAKKKRTARGNRDATPGNGE